MRLDGAEGLPLPARMTEHAAGFDLPAAVHRPLVLRRGQIRLIPCGFAMAVPHGYEAQVRPRSGLAARHGVTMINGPGTIDSDYRGEVMVPMINLGRPDVKILDDGWTAVTRDRSLSAQFEHSVGITDTGCEIFTKSPAGLDSPPYAA